MDKSYVTLATCPICREGTGELLLDRRLRPMFDMYTVTSEPCDKCRKKYLSKGVLLLSPDTGDLVVVKNSAFKRMFEVELPKRRIALVSQEIINNINKQNNVSKRTNKSSK